MNSAFGDIGDALGFPNQGPTRTYASMPVPKLASEYNMNHPKRGLAYIFNNEIFDNNELKKRSGTAVDCENLRTKLVKLNFDVKVYKDLNYSDIDKYTNQAARMDHSQCDCIMVTILSHGIAGYVYARDKEYKLDSITGKFTADKCPTLAGKPKLFFIQACQGEGLDSGTTLIQTDSGNSIEIDYKIPNHADFLIAYSTIPGFYSWRNTTKGSWFMQALCKELDDNGTNEDLLSILTTVIRRVATDYESNTPDNPDMHQQKQIPCVITMLTRKLYFKKKN